MKERPILFSGPMIRAILDGTKTQTRRVMKPQPTKSGAIPQSPFGDHGDRLWVRETFVVESNYGIDSCEEYPPPNKDGRPTRYIKDDPDHGNYWEQPHYRATDTDPHVMAHDQDPDDDRTRWRPSIFMPRWASRITLLVTSVDVQRLQDISTADIMAEGVKIPLSPNGHWLARATGEHRPHDYLGDKPEGSIITADEIARAEWAALWDGLNHKRGFGWETNPFVWVVRFQVIQ